MGAILPCCCAASPPKYQESVLCRQLGRFCRKGTQHFQITNEDRLAFEKLRELVLAEEDPLKLAVFDLALFCSMAMECKRLEFLHSQVRESDPDPRMPQRARAIKDFRIAALKTQYRHINGASGFSQLVTFAVLTNMHFMLLFNGPDETKPAKKIQFAKNACYVKDHFEDAIIAKDEVGADVSISASNGIPSGDGEDRQFLIIRYGGSAGPGVYRWVEGRNVRAEPLDLGIAFHFRKWLEYARSFRGSMELCKPGGNVLHTAVGLLMLFESVHS